MRILTYLIDMREHELKNPIRLDGQIDRGVIFPVKRGFLYLRETLFRTLFYILGVVSAENISVLCPPIARPCITRTGIAYKLERAQHGIAVFGAVNHFRDFAEKLIGIPRGIDHKLRAAVQ